MNSPRRPGELAMAVPLLLAPLHQSIELGGADANPNHLDARVGGERDPSEQPIYRLDGEVRARHRWTDADTRRTVMWVAIYTAMTEDECHVRKS